MLDKRDRQIISVLRENAREKLMHISSKTGIPSSTIHERLAKLEQRGIRMVSIPDYREVNVPLVYWVVLSTKNRDKMRQQLQQELSVNTLLETNNGADFICECVFTSFAEQHRFAMDMTEFGQAEFYPMIEVISKEKAKI